MEWHGYVGTVPQELVDVDSEQMQLWHSSSSDLVSPDGAVRGGVAT